MSKPLQHPPIAIARTTSSDLTIANHGGTNSNANANANVNGLESSLLNLVHQHQISSSSLRRQREKSKKQAIRAGNRVSELLVDAVNSGVQKSFVHQKQIEFEIRSLTTSINRFHKQTQQWLTASHSLNTAIKEIGDFENWIKVMEYDCKSITAAIRNIHRHQP